ncbi:RNA polymerase ADP-ribosylase [Shigella phage SP18]|uniref:NAD(+)--arginine ADP-ribosyltransferase n=1 Tax=Shigella phage SP18 TaxID=645664 RepID=E3SF15_BPSP8|nr:Alt-like RNA polymerase ADP-ribosyltransferase [Shigella phage SP18]ADO19552.1 RNA polymerase ADP-ribosylase [Shigella phage SP18]
MTELLSEVFEGESNIPAINLSKSKVPQIWNIQVPGNDNLIARMVSYASEGDAIKQVKTGDKYAHVILMSLNSNGTPAILKGGLGDNPIGAIKSIFDVVYEQVKLMKMDAIMFRFPTRKMKGQERTIQRVLARLIMARAGGQFKVLDDMYQYTGKHTYVLIYRKSKPIESIAGIPGINTELYTKVESKVGDVYVDKATGETVTKNEAIAASIAKVEEKRTDQAVVVKTKFSKRAAINALYSGNEPTGLAKFSPEHKEIYTKLSTSSAVHSADDARESQIAKASIKVIDRAGDEYADYFDLVAQGGVGEDKTKTRVAMDVFNALKEVDMEHKISEFSNVLRASKNPVDTLRRVADMLLDDSIVGTWAREDKTKEAIRIIADEIYTKAIQPLFHISDNPEITEDQAEAIKAYTRGKYTAINNFLLGKADAKESEIKMISDMDKVFENGVKLPKGTIIYRAQVMPTDMAINSIKNKTMYLPMFASTSLAPNIFGRMGHTAANLDPNALSSDIDDGAIDATIKSATGSAKPTIKIGMIIKGAENIKVVIPGDLANWSVETEVILPRGTMLKIDKVYGATAGMMGSMGKYILVECSILENDQIDESNSLLKKYDRISYDLSMEKLVHLLN